MGHFGFVEFGTPEVRLRHFTSIYREIDFSIRFTKPGGRRCRCPQRPKAHVGSRVCILSIRLYFDILLLTVWQPLALSSRRPRRTNDESNDSTLTERTWSLVIRLQPAASLLAAPSSLLRSPPPRQERRGPQGGRGVRLTIRGLSPDVSWQVRGDGRVQLQTHIS